ncbi:MAG: PIG-L family deacetylase [Planctomycetes bacterium]|nr:PIG-L family deacetylase [Planctomycetota bacterium]
MPAEPPAAGHYALVVVSPHLDDAVFSCAGAIAAARARGPVLVLNVFSRFSGEVRRHGVVLGAMRQEEERRAAAALGFASVCLDELDASCRRPEYRAIGNVFRPPVAADEAWLPALRDRLQAALAGCSWDLLLAPLAVGWHVDHLLVHRALAGWRGRPDLAWYEDVPYCWIAEALRLRLDELGRHPGDEGDPGLAPRPAPLAARRLVADYARSALMRRLRPAPLRWLAGPVVAGYLRRLVAAHAGSPRPERPRWVPQHLPLADPAARIAAMASYRSQFDAFFLDQEDCRRRLAAHAALVPGGHAAVERRWRVAEGMCAPA